MRESNHKLAVAMILAMSAPLMARSFPKPQAKFDRPLVSGDGVRRMFGIGTKHHMNSPKECKRRVKQMAAGTHISG